MKRVVVLASGSGTNLQALMEHAEQSKHWKVVGVITNTPGATCIKRANKQGIAGAVIDHTAFDSRESFDYALAEKVAQFAPDLVVLAGFMRILTPVFVERYLGRLVNIHPSLLPKYPGLNTYQRAIDAGDRHAGATVHFVTAELDGGPPVIHGKVSIDAADTADTLSKRILTEIEHNIFAQAVDWFCTNQLDFQAGKAYLNNDLIPAEGFSWPLETPLPTTSS